MARLLSGKVKKTPYAGLSTDRYEFIQLSETEPNAGLPSVDGHVLASDTNGNRFWRSAPGASAINGITVKEEGSIVGTADSVSSLNFVGNNVVATASGVGATVTISDTPTFTSLAVTGLSTFQGNVNVTANLAVDTNTLFVNSANNRIGIGTDNPAYQVEIENTGANALLVLDRTDGAACFIEGQATRSAFGSVNDTPLALAHNSAAVVLIGAGGSIRVNPDGDGFTFPTIDGSANQVLQTDGDGNLSFVDQSSGGSDEHILPVMTRTAQGTGSKNDAVMVTILAGINTVTGRFGSNVNVTENALVPFRETVGISTHSLIETFFNTVV